ncbi:MAG: translation initiation factor IF-2 [Sedimentisphaerales bacterium]|nr:translation initiation factor IF-2 [Sedimentisphaerales bacterium]
MASTRVYILAKELGVKSLAIVKKCQDEELDVKNHMSTISAGLAATIREWFSEGENVTTIETAEKVDLDKVKIKKKKKAKPERKKVTEAEAQAEEAAAEAVSKAEDTGAESAQAGVAVAEEKPKPEPKKKEKPKPKPKPVVPAGPRLEKPAPAKLSGPQVVRVEEPEVDEPKVIRRPRPKRRFDEPVTEPLMETAPEKLQEQITKKGKKGASKRRKARTHGRRRDEEGSVSEGSPEFISQRRQRDLEERKARLSAAGGEGMRLRPVRKIASKKSAQTMQVVRPEKTVISEPINVKNLSAALAVKTTDIIAKLLQQGVMATANQTISADVAELVAIEFGIELTVEKKATIEEVIEKEFADRERKNLKRRSVVVTMLGHVDHGKTSLLDKIRSTQVQAGEAGGITQHIGASQVNWNGHKITFLDTPGHEAFTAMRARGANMTDVVVLVVAADDGVMPQTIEAINHAKAAGVPVLVALNKIDIGGCDINRIYSQLAEHEMVPVEWSGKTEVVKTSAVTGDGVENLLEHLDYVAELIDLKADDTIPATGWVVEARMSPQRGPVATLLLKEGKIQKGDVVLAGMACGKVKTLRDSKGKSIKSATSSAPIEVTGLNDVPQAGDRFFVLDDINRAKEASEEQKSRKREKTLAKRAQVTMDNLFSQIEEGQVKELNIIIKADVQGSVDVLTKYLSELSTDEVKIKILHAAPGGITEGDVLLAEASNALIIGFNVVADEKVGRIAEERGVDINLYSVIYRITEDLRKAMVGLLEPEEKEQSVGRAVVRNIFKISRLGTIAGCYVSDGLARRDAKVRLIRDNIVIRDDLRIASLKHFKDDAREVKTGFECGIKLTKFDDIKVDDVLDFYEIIKVARTL